VLTTRVVSLYAAGSPAEIITVLPVPCPAAAVLHAEGAPSRSRR
jgi:hypothetical protein